MQACLFSSDQILTIQFTDWSKLECYNELKINVM